MWAYPASARLKTRFFDNEIKSFTRIWQWSRKTEFFYMFELSQVFSESCGHQSLCSIHVIKPTHPNFDHTKYEPDISNLARKKWGVKIEVNCQTPCRAQIANLPISPVKYIARN